MKKIVVISLMLIASIVAPQMLNAADWHWILNPKDHPDYRKRLSVWWKEAGNTSAYVIPCFTNKDGNVQYVFHVRDDGTCWPFGGQALGHEGHPVVTAARTASAILGLDQTALQNLIDHTKSYRTKDIYARSWNGKRSVIYITTFTNDEAQQILHNINGRAAELQRSRFPNVLKDAYERQEPMIVNNGDSKPYKLWVWNHGNCSEGASITLNDMLLQLYSALNEQDSTVIGADDRIRYIRNR